MIEIAMRDHTNEDAYLALQDAFVNFCFCDNLDCYCNGNDTFYVYGLTAKNVKSSDFNGELLDATEYPDEWWEFVVNAEDMPEYRSPIKF